MTPAVVPLLTFLTGVLLVVGAYSLYSDLVLRDRTRIALRVDQEFRQRQRDRIRKSALFRGPGRFDPGVLDEDALPALGPRERLALLIEQADLRFGPGKLMLAAVVAGAALTALGLLLRPYLAVALLLFPVGAAGPFLYVWRRRRQRQDRLLGQLPDAFDLMARVLRAGQTLSQALQAVADELDPPLGAEFAHCYEQQNLGLSGETALRDLARRTGLLEMKVLAFVLVVQQQAGGNLAEVLDRLARVIRERIAMRGKIRALTSEGRLQAALLLVLPPALLAILSLMSAEFARAYSRHPSVLLGLFLAEGVGALWIWRIVDFDF